MIDSQTLINLGLSTVLTVIGWFARELWDAVNKLKEDVHQIEVELPTSYVQKEEYNKTMERIESYVAKIFDKLDNKVDK
jgi:hypothetical protein